jgi:hypothetical protein
MLVHSERQRTRVESSALPRADIVRALGIQMRLAPTRAERAAAARALLAFRARETAACELCGVPFERYVHSAFGTRRFCSRAHQTQAYRHEHAERLREQDRARHASGRRASVGKPCSRCGKPFVQTRATKRYCGQSCRQLAYLERHGLRARPRHLDAERRSGDGHAWRPRPTGTPLATA